MRIPASLPQIPSMVGALLGAALLTAPLQADEAFDVSQLQVLNDRAVPEVCFSFTKPLSSEPEAFLEDYVLVEPKIDMAVNAQGESLCVSGLDFGTRYEVTLRAGLPDASGDASLAKNLPYDVYVPDRPASLTFLGDQGYILLKDLAKGLPIRAVNLPQADFKIIKVNDRNLVPQIAQNSLGGQGQLWPNEVQTYEDDAGVAVWSGSLDLPAGKENQANDSQIPVAPILEKTPEPGLYLAVARDPNADSWQPWASQWFLISDIGLTSFQAENALWVFARSLADATPQAGMELQLLAKDNAVLATAKTDDDGKVSFPAAALRGPGGKAPRALLAYGGSGDFTFLDLTGPALDLSDRPITGRTPPGAVEAYVYTERGIYRPGEQLHLTALVRNRALAAEEKLPLTFKLWRPDGVAFRAQVAPDAGGGAHAWSPTLPGTARTGLWEATAHLGDTGPAIGRVSFQVEDFVPPQIEFDLTTTAALAAVNQVIPASLKADYLYGAPAANLAGEYTLLVQPADAPFKDFADYHFGLVQQSVTPQRSDPVSFTTDAEGKADLQAMLESLPDSMAPLSVSLRAAVFDLGGRAVYRRVTLPLADKDYYLGIRPGFPDGTVPQGQQASFQVVALDRQGAEQAADFLDYRIYREDYDFIWYRDQGEWKSRWVVRDSLADQGTLDISPGQPGELDFKPDWGPYRLEVSSEDGNIASSYRFSGGWWRDPSADTPDDVEVSLDAKSYGAGTTAKAFIKPPFDAHVLVTVADSDLRWSKLVDVSREGTVVEIPVAADWTAGAYVIANAYPKKPASIEALPTRAVGLAWLARSQAPHALDVALTLPEKMQPAETLEVPIAVSGAAAGAEVRVTLAAVDDAVLQMTGYQAPDPLGWFLAKQALGVQLHDLYGYLIKPQGEALAQLRSGGDQEGRNLESLPERSSKVVSLFSGIVALDESGQGRISLQVPDFNGRLRVMAVAWSPEKLGAAQQTLIVRAPLIAELTLPRFLAPGDVADSVISLRNLDGAAGDYQVAVTGDGVVSVSGGSLSANGLAQGQEARAQAKLTGSALGVADIALTVTGPEGYRLERSFALSVRPASPVISERKVALLQPGRSTTVSSDTATGFLPGRTTVGLSLSTTPNFDLPGVLAALDRYPYGCAEQTTSRALPLLYVNQVAQALGLGDDASLSLRVQQSIYRLINQQRGNGAFGLWGPFGTPQVWLTAYVGDFLTRAKAAGFHVPDAGYEAILDWLEGQTRRYLSSPEDFAGYAYAQYVLTSAGRGERSELRYFYETRFDKLPTAFARGQFAAALATAGDRTRAAAAFQKAVDATSSQAVHWADYGSRLRDDAALVALMAESGAAPAALLSKTVESLSADFADRQHLSTQEMAWLVLASQGLVGEAGGLSLSVDGTPLADPGKAFYRKLDLAAAGPQSLTVANQGQGPLYQVVTISGVPEQALPATSEGFNLRRRVFDLKGLPVALDSLQQGESYVVVLEGRSQDGRAHRALVVDLLPAGWEIENAALGQGVPLASFPWLGKLTTAEHREARDDRFAAAVNLTEDLTRFRLAYIVRAVTPGSFTLPGSFIEDMYRPDLQARGAQGQVTIAGR
ncbi:MAG: alpha-2-macroglobulin [Pseudomonadota bacterium]